MDKLNIEICSCTECVMNGSMDIMEAIEQFKESIEEYKDSFNTDVEINITPVKCLGDAKHSVKSPRISINGYIFENANTETIISEIVAKLKRNAAVR